MAKNEGSQYLSINQPVQASASLKQTQVCFSGSVVRVQTKAKWLRSSKRGKLDQNHLEHSNVILENGLNLRNSSIFNEALEPSASLSMPQSAENAHKSLARHNTFILTCNNEIIDSQLPQLHYFIIGSILFII